MATTARALRTLELGGGTVVRGDPTRLILPPIESGYADAQLDDHRHLPRRDFPWRPPLVMELEARTDLARPLGTLGFGFWNDPFAFSFGQAGAARKLPAAPNALWFFYGSPPNDLSLTAGAPGSGWKASSLRTPQVPSPLLALPAALAFGLSYLPLFRGWIVRTAKGIVTASEVELEIPLTEWHEYKIEWRRKSASFFVDGALKLTASRPPQGPLGFVTWIDNQYAALTTERGIRFGVLPTERQQSLELRNLAIHPIE